METSACNKYEMDSASKDGHEPLLISCEAVSSTQAEPFILKESMEQISDLLLPYSTSHYGVPAEVAMRGTISTEKVPQILFKVLQEFEKLQVEHRRQTLIVSQYETIVMRYFNMVGELQPPTLLGEEKKLYGAHSQVDLDSKESNDAVPAHDLFKKNASSSLVGEPSVWLWKYLKELRGAVSDSAELLQRYLLDSCQADHLLSDPNSINQNNIFRIFSPSGDDMNDIWNAIRASCSLAEDEYCSEENGNVAHQYISAVLSGAIASLKGWKYVSQRISQKVENVPPKFIVQIEKKIQNTVLLLQGKAEKINEMDECDLEDNEIEEMRKDETMSNDCVLENRALERVLGLLAKLDSLIAKQRPEAIGNDSAKEELSQLRGYIEEERSKCRKLEREHEDGIELLAMALHSSTNRNLLGMDLRDSKAGVTASGSVFTLSQRIHPDSSGIAKDNELASLMNCFHTSQKELCVSPIGETREKDILHKDFRLLISELNQRWKSTIQSYEKKELGLKKKLSELGQIKSVIQEHTKSMRTEVSPQGIEGEGKNMDRKEDPDVTKFEASPLFLPDTFDASQLKDHLTFLRRKYFGLQKQQRLGQYDSREQKAQLERLTHQLGSIKKWQAQCSSILLNDIAPLLGLEDDVGLLLWREESGNGKKVNGSSTLSPSPTPTLSGLMMVSVLKLFSEDLKRVRSAKLEIDRKPSFSHNEEEGERSKNGPFLSLDIPKEGKGIVSRGPEEVTKESRMRKGVGQTEKVKEEKEKDTNLSEDETSFREAMSAVLCRLVDSGKRIKETLFVLGTDETAADELLEDLTQMFSKNEQNAKSREAGRVKDDGRPPLCDNKGITKVSVDAGENMMNQPTSTSPPALSLTMVEQRLGELLQKYGRWTTRLLETVEDHRAAQRRFSRHFASVLFYFSRMRGSCFPGGCSSNASRAEGMTSGAMLPSTSTSTSTCWPPTTMEGSEGDGGALRDVAEGIIMGREALNNLIDLDCVLLDSMEMLLPIMEEEAEGRGRNGTVFLGKGKMEMKGEVSAEKERGVCGGVGRDENGIEEENVSQEKEEELKEGEKQNAPDHELCDKRLLNFYSSLRETHTVLFGLTRVQYLVAPPPERDPDPACFQRSSGEVEEGKDVDAGTSHGLEHRETIESIQSQYVDISLDHILHSDPPDFASPAERREYYNNALYEIIAQNLQCIQRQLFFLSDAIKDVAIVVEQDVEGLRQQVMKMLGEWSAVDVEESWIGQKRSVLEELYEELSLSHNRDNPRRNTSIGREVKTRNQEGNQVTRSLSYWMARRHTSQNDHEGTRQGKGTFLKREPKSYSPPVWQVALELLGDGLGKLILYLSSKKIFLHTSQSGLPPQSPLPEFSRDEAERKEEDSLATDVNRPRLKNREKEDYKNDNNSTSSNSNSGNTNANMDLLVAELNDIGAIYVNWIENEEQGMKREEEQDEGSRTCPGAGHVLRDTPVKKPSIPPLPHLVQQCCVREGSGEEERGRESMPYDFKSEKENTTQQEVEVGKGVAPSSSRLGGGQEITRAVTPRERNARGSKASYFSSTDALPLLFLHMLGLAQTGWTCMVNQYYKSGIERKAAAENSGSAGNRWRAGKRGDENVTALPSSVPPRLAGAGPSKREVAKTGRTMEGNVRMIPIGPVCVPVPASSSFNSPDILSHSPSSTPPSISVSPERSGEAESDGPARTARIRSHVPPTQLPSHASVFPFFSLFAPSSPILSSSSSTQEQLPPTDPEIEWWWRQMNETHPFTPPYLSTSVSQGGKPSSGTGRATNQEGTTILPSSSPFTQVSTPPPPPPPHPTTTTSTRRSATSTTAGGAGTSISLASPSPAPSALHTSHPPERWHSTASAAPAGAQSNICVHLSPPKTRSNSSSSTSSSTQGGSSSSSRSTPSTSTPSASMPTPSREDMLQDVLTYLQNTLDPSSWGFIDKARKKSLEIQQKSKLHDSFKKMPKDVFPLPAPSFSPSSHPPPASAPSAPAAAAAKGSCLFMGRTTDGLEIRQRKITQKEAEEKENQAGGRVKRKKENYPTQSAHHSIIPTTTTTTAGAAAAAAVARAPPLSSNLRKKRLANAEGGRERQQEWLRSPPPPFSSHLYGRGSNTFHRDDKEVELEEEDDDDEEKMNYGTMEKKSTTRASMKKCENRSHCHHNHYHERDEDKEEAMRQRRLRRELGLSLLSEKERQSLLQLLEGGTPPPSLKSFSSPAPDEVQQRRGGVMLAKESFHSSSSPMMFSSLPHSRATTTAVPNQGFHSAKEKTRHLYDSSRSSRCAKLAELQEEGDEEQGEGEEEEEEEEEREMRNTQGCPAMDPILFGTRSARLRCQSNKNRTAASASAAKSPPATRLGNTSPRSVQCCLEKERRRGEKWAYSCREWDHTLGERGRTKEGNSSQFPPTSPRESSEYRWATRSEPLPLRPAYESSSLCRSKTKERKHREEEEEKNNTSKRRSTPSHCPGRMATESSPRYAREDKKERQTVKEPTRRHRFPYAVDERFRRLPVRSKEDSSYSVRTPTPPLSLSSSFSYSRTSSFFSSLSSSLPAPRKGSTGGVTGKGYSHSPVAKPIQGDRAGAARPGRGTFREGSAWIDSDPSASRLAHSSSPPSFDAPIFAVQSQYPASVSRCRSTDRAPPRRMRVMGKTGGMGR